MSIHQYSTWRSEICARHCVDKCHQDTESVQSCEPGADRAWALWATFFFFSFKKQLTNIWYILSSNWKSLPIQGKQCTIFVFNDKVWKNEKKGILHLPLLAWQYLKKKNQDLSDESLVLMVPQATSWHWTTQCLNIWVIFIIQCTNTSKCLMQLHFYFRFLTVASI